MHTVCMESSEGFLFLERTSMGNIAAGLFKVQKVMRIFRFLDVHL